MFGKVFGEAVENGCELVCVLLKVFDAVPPGFEETTGHEGCELVAVAVNDTEAESVFPWHLFGFVLFGSPEAFEDGGEGNGFVGDDDACAEGILYSAKNWTFLNDWNFNVIRLLSRFFVFGLSVLITSEIAVLNEPKSA